MAFPLSDQEHQAIKARIDGQTELVVAAAIRFDGLILSVQRPGRHGDCLNWLSRNGIGRKPNGENHECGFVTNRGRFVGRSEAGQIVLANEQGSPGGNPINNPHMGLFSEDMWNEDHEPAGPIDPTTIFSRASDADGKGGG